MIMADPDMRHATRDIRDAGEDIGAIAGPRLAEAQATVVAVRQGIVTVAPQKAGGCAGCGAVSHCGTAALQKLIGRPDSTLRVKSGLDVAAGDRVTLLVPESGLVLAAALTYLLPLVSLFTATLCVAAIGGSEHATIAAAIAGLAAGILAARKVANTPGILASLVPVRLKH